MTKVLKSKELIEKIKDNIKKVTKNIKEEPIVAIIRVGKKPDDISYEKGITKKAKELGIGIQIFKFDEKESTEVIAKRIRRLNDDEKVKGILVFKPLPNTIDEKQIDEAISYKKDIDCISPISKSMLFDGDVTGFIPNAPKAAIRILEYYGYDLSKNCLIINRTSVVGKPLLMLLLDKNATVTIAHSKTKNLKELTKSADYIFTATGKKRLLDKSFFKEDAVVIDMGIAIDENGKLVGDLDTEGIEGTIEAYTPVPGGIGALTSILLLESAVINNFNND